MKNITKTLILTVILITIIPIVVFASTLTLKVSTNQSKYEVGENVVATVNWAEKMQAASYKIKYDSDILELKSASIANTYYNVDTVGEISINWASMEEKDLTNTKYALRAAFSTYIIGTVNRGANSVYGRATGELFKVFKR